MIVVPWFEAAARFCAERIEGTERADFDPGEGAVVMDGNKIVAAAVYHQYRPSNRTIEMSIAADHPRWATRGTIKQLLAYPFSQLGCIKVVALIMADNWRSIKLVQGLGFEREALLKRHASGRDLVVCSMFVETWLERWSSDGRQEFSQSA